MRDLQEYAQRCMDMLDELNIPYNNFVCFKVSPRAQKRWGSCKNTGVVSIIRVNKVLLDERNDEKGLMNTLLHELLHTVKGCVHHNVVWQQYADKVNQAYGYNVKRTSTCEEKGVLEETRNITVKYELRCEKCGYSIQRLRMSSLVEHPEKYRHSNCGGVFVRVK